MVRYSKRKQYPTPPDCSYLADDDYWSYSDGNRIRWQIADLDADGKYNHFRTRICNFDDLICDAGVICYHNRCPRFLAEKIQRNVSVLFLMRSCWVLQNWLMIRTHFSFQKWARCVILKWRLFLRFYKKKMEIAKWQH